MGPMHLLFESLLPFNWPALLSRPWWYWEPSEASTGDWAYHLFNLAEATAWFVIAVVIVRRSRQVSQWVDRWLAFTLLLFGLSDVAEAWMVSIALVAVKLMILITLLLLKKRRATLRAAVAEIPQRTSL